MEKKVKNILLEKARNDGTLFDLVGKHTVNLTEVHLDKSSVISTFKIEITEEDIDRFLKAKNAPVAYYY